MAKRGEIPLQHRAVQNRLRQVTAKTNKGIQAAKRASPLRSTVNRQLKRKISGRP